MTLALALAAACVPALAQRSLPRPNPQQLPRGDDDSTRQQTLIELPDTLIVNRFDPREPRRLRPVLDSALDLAYFRYDPIARHGPDYVYLASLAQPAAANPILGADFRPYRQLLQARHPAYEPLEAPFMALNVPYAYTAYNQGGEVDDGQVRILFGSPFANGWQLGFAYARTYPSGRNNRYPRSSGDRIQLAGALSFTPDSSHHRAYAALSLNSWGFDNAGGYTFALEDTLEVPESPFTAIPLLRTFRTEGRRRGFTYLHRYFLREQTTGTSGGWAASAEVDYHIERQRSSTTEADSALFGPFRIDDRGLRHSLRERTVLAKAGLEYFSAPRAGGGLDFDLRAGVYTGQQRFTADFVPGALPQNLFGVYGRFATTLREQFALTTEATVPLDGRAGLGQLRGRLAWNYRDRLALEAKALLERTDAPFVAEYVGVNDVLLARMDFVASTHTRLGLAVSYRPLGARVEAYLETFSGGWTFGAFGIARGLDETVAIPTLALATNLRWRYLRSDHRGVLRATTGNRDVYLPAYTGQHSLYAEAFLFDRAMQLLGGVDTWVRSPSRLYGYAPLAAAFHVRDDAGTLGWQYTADLFFGFKVQSFKLLLRLDNAFVADLAGAPPRTVAGFPVVRSAPDGFSAGMFRLGISFSLYN